jgi:two-component system alkaline phosphatase synthesis response regulator PhoP
MMNSRILLVEDEPGVVLVVSDLLRSEGHEVESAADGKTGYQMITEGKYDLLILDVMLPGMDGVTLCGKARAQGFTGAILMLTAKGMIEDRVAGLKTGADDYLVKPFHPAELTARVVALLRRVHKSELTPVMKFQFGSVVADFVSGEVRRDGELVVMTAKELQLLRYFVDHRGQVLSRERLLAQLWSEQPFITPRTVDVYVSWLRQKLEENVQSPRWIVTLRGEGYRFEGS